MQMEAGHAALPPPASRPAACLKPHHRPWIRCRRGRVGRSRPAMEPPPLPHRSRRRKEPRRSGGSSSPATGRGPLRRAGAAAAPLGHHAASSLRSVRRRYVSPVVDLPPLPAVSPIRPLTAHPPAPLPRFRHRLSLARGSAAPARQDNKRVGLPPSTLPCSCCLPASRFDYGWRPRPGPRLLDPSFSPRQHTTLATILSWAAPAPPTCSPQ
ncbi:unnamed protein product [Urochloa humidicola]